MAEEGNYPTGNESRRQPAKKRPPKPREEMQAYIDEEGRLLVNLPGENFRELGDPRTMLAWLIEWDFRETQS